MTFGIEKAMDSCVDSALALRRSWWVVRSETELGRTHSRRNFARCGKIEEGSGHLTTIKIGSSQISELKTPRFASLRSESPSKESRVESSFPPAPAPFEVALKIGWLGVLRNRVLCRSWIRRRLVQLTSLPVAPTVIDELGRFVRQLRRGSGENKSGCARHSGVCTNGQKKTPGD